MILRGSSGGWGDGDDPLYCVGGLQSQEVRKRGLEQCWAWTVGDGTQHAELSEERTGKESGWEERQIPFLPVRPTLGVRLPSMRRWCSMINGRR